MSKLDKVLMSLSLPPNLEYISNCDIVFAKELKKDKESFPKKQTDCTNFFEQTLAEQNHKDN